MNFQILAETIQQMHLALFNESVKAVNRNLTLRNWLIGYYIVEYEQAGEDRATYGAKLLMLLLWHKNQDKQKQLPDQRSRSCF